MLFRSRVNSAGAVVCSNINITGGRITLGKTVITESMFSFNADQDDDIGYQLISSNYTNTLEPYGMIIDGSTYYSSVTPGEMRVGWITQADAKRYLARIGTEPTSTGHKGHIEVFEDDGTTQTSIFDSDDIRIVSDAYNTSDYAIDISAILTANTYETKVAPGAVRVEDNSAYLTINSSGLFFNSKTRSSGAPFIAQIGISSGNGGIATYDSNGNILFDSNAYLPHTEYLRSQTTDNSGNVSTGLGSTYFVYGAMSTDSTGYCIIPFYSTGASEWKLKVVRQDSNGNLVIQPQTSLSSITVVYVSAYQ